MPLARVFSSGCEGEGRRLLTPSVSICPFEHFCSSVTAAQRPCKGQQSLCFRSESPPCSHFRVHTEQLPRRTRSPLAHSDSQAARSSRRQRAPRRGGGSGWCLLSLCLSTTWKVRLKCHLVRLLPRFSLLYLSTALGAFLLGLPLLCDTRAPCGLWSVPTGLWASCEQNL